MSAAWVLWSVVAVAWAYFLWLRRKFYMFALKLGGPWGLPFIGIGLELLWDKGVLKVFPKYARLYKRKTYFAWVGLLPGVYTVDPNVINIVLQSPNCLNKHQGYSPTEYAIGNGILTSKCPKWNVHRKLLNPLFTHKTLVPLIPAFNRITRRFCDKLEKAVGRGEVEVQDFIYEHGVATSFGINLGVNIEGETVGKQIAAFDRLQESATNRFLKPWQLVNAIYRLSSDYKLFIQARRCIVDFIHDTIRAKIDNKTPEVGLDGGTDHKLFIDEVVKLYQRNEFTMENAIDECFVVLFGAFETTSHSLFTVLIFLATHQDVQDRAYEELCTLFPDKEFDVAYEDLKKVPYLEMIINEALRLSAPVPIIGRTCEKDLPIGEGLIIPAGTNVYMDLYNMQRDEDLWGPKALAFNPDRFLSNEQNPAFMPFSKGRRNCIGWFSGTISLKVTLAHVLRRYKFSTTVRPTDLKVVQRPTIKYAFAPKMQIERR